ncbi:MAG: dihydrofolate reductase [Bacteroidetes bacterium]|nr:MAG: dihydrofolate reductase [Bacteroidota bacterium]
MKSIKFLALIVVAASLAFCGNNGEKKAADAKNDSMAVLPDTFTYKADQFADIRVLRYRIAGFENLTYKQKELAYYLYEAALAGKDIIWDQNYKYNLTVRKTLEKIVSSYKGDKNSNDWKNFMTYAKRVWFSNGIHHHYSSNKILPECSKEYFAELIRKSHSNLEKAQDYYLPMSDGEGIEEFIKRITPILFDPKVAAKRVNLDSKMDLVASSATNFYEGVTEKEATEFYEYMTESDAVFTGVQGGHVEIAAKTKNPTPPSYGLNSKLMKENGKLVEKKWALGGMYSDAIEKIIYWLEKASAIGENDAQKKAIDLLVQFYKTGDLKIFDDYCIAWVNDTSSVLDVVNGFIEVYGDPLGRKGSFESVVSIKDFEASKRIAAIGTQAQWFEDNSTLMPAHRKKNVKGISAKVITTVIETGDAAPTTPIGINLPNANWIRQQHGSKSVSLGNIVFAYEKAKSPSLINEFYIKEDMNRRVKEHGALAGALHTDMHEVIGHASGQINPGIGDPSETLKSYASALEEGRADLVALYFILDKKLVEIGVMPSIEVGKAEYDNYITNGLMVQLARLKLGEQIEESHMRNRQMIAKWAFEKGEKDNVIERKKTEDGRTYFVINDYDKLRVLFGELLKEVQRVKSEGDYNAGKNLIENYGVKVDKDLHKEVLDRYNKTGIAPYAGFIQPKLVPVTDGDKIVDVKVEYPFDFVEQMMEFGRKYALLPTVN